MNASVAFADGVVLSISLSAFDTHLHAQLARAARIGLRRTIESREVFSRCRRHQHEATIVLFQYTIVVYESDWPRPRVRVVANARTRLVCTCTLLARERELAKAPPYTRRGLSRLVLQLASGAYDRNDTD